MRKITVARLRKLGACAEQIEKFAELFPRGIMPTRALCLEHTAVFNWDWAAEHLLPAPALAAYDAAIASAWAAYEAAGAPAWAAYKAARASAWADAAGLP
jgi:hypothetical protein